MDWAWSASRYLHEESLRLPDGVHSFTWCTGGSPTAVGKSQLQMAWWCFGNLEASKRQTNDIACLGVRCKFLSDTLCCIVISYSFLALRCSGGGGGTPIKKGRGFSSRILKRNPKRYQDPVLPGGRSLKLFSPLRGTSFKTTHYLLLFVLGLTP